MNTHEATQLLDKTFNNTFDINQMASFVKELFNTIDIQYIDKSQYIANQYREYISEVMKLGSYTKDEKKMEILVVKLKKTSSRDRARTMQRNFIANWLNKMDIDAALVAFHGEEPEDWRFSFVKMEYNLVRDEEGKVKIAKELTPAKRYSYLVGVNEPNHTCRSQFLEMISEENIQPSLSDIENAFSIEKVTKEFFEKYKERVIDLQELLEKVVAKDKRVRKEFEKCGIDTIDFSKKLLGQIVFIYFLQKKGWLGIGKDKSGEFGEWGTGPKNFLRRLFNGDYGSYENFFNDVLEHLLYDALARPRDNDYYGRFNCKIPFLNGGLFEPINDYDWTSTDILIDNKIFEKILGTFDEFNFTVKEDEPLEKEVAVDPEMLGKVFENLLGVKERKDKGAFYTPREIVHYMCQQSLINYLETNTSVSREDIERFIQFGDLTLANDQRILMELESKREKLKKGVIGPSTFEKEFNQLLDSFSLPRSIIDKKEIIDRLLQEIKIVDPAVGSGAFPVGMMNEILKARSVLTIFFDPDEQEERNVYKLKRDCIENSLYGVDIDPSAVEIAKLRFWLALIVDEEKKENIKPLPNLDHKIMCGNSLLEEFEGIKLFDQSLLEVEDTKSAQQYEIEEIKKQLESLYKLKGKIVLGQEKGESLQDVEKKISGLERKRKRLLKPKTYKTSITTLEEALQQRKRDSQRKLMELRKLHKEYFNEQSRDKKKDLRENIDTLEWELVETTLEEQDHPEALEKLEQYKKSQSKPFFLWKLQFAEVFQRENPGFDVVIANPPYVDSENMVKEMPELRVIYTNKFQSAKGNWDLFIVFIDQGLNLLRKQGVISYIVPNKLIGAKYSETLKKILIKNQIIEIRDYSSVDVFKEADVYPVTFVISENLPDNDVIMSLMDDLDLIGNTNIIPPEIFYADIDWARYFVRDIRALSVVIKLCKNNPLVESFQEVFGAATVNEAYELKNIILDTDTHTENIKKFINTGTIDPYISLWGHKVTRYIKQGYQHPVVKDSDLKSFKNSRYQQTCSEKVIIGGMTKNLECFYDSGAYLAGKSTTIILPGKASLKVLVALLNSKLISFWYRIFFKSLSLSGGYLRISNNEIKRIPLAIINDKEREKIIKIVDEILRISKDDDYLTNISKKDEVQQLQVEIDELVYNIYDLTTEEIEIVVKFMNDENGD